MSIQLVSIQYIAENQTFHITSPNGIFPTRDITAEFKDSPVAQAMVAGNSPNPLMLEVKVGE